MRNPFSLGITATLVGTVALFAVPSSRVRAEDGSKIYDRLLRSTAWVLVTRSQEQIAGKTRVTFSSGTGTLIDVKKRLVLTNYHVVGDRPDADVLFPAFRGNRPIAERDHYMEIYRN